MANVRALSAILALLPSMMLLVGESSAETYPAHSVRLIVPFRKEGDVDMLGLIAVVLIVLWLLGFLAFHVSAGLIHLMLIVGIVLLVLHFVRGSTRTA